MAKCWQCGKRANTRHSCVNCGRGPMCLKCVCAPCAYIRSRRIEIWREEAAKGNQAAIDALKESEG